MGFKQDFLRYTDGQAAVSVTRAASQLEFKAEHRDGSMSLRRLCGFQNLTAALEAANVTGSEGTLNARAKCAAKSAFESNKHLLKAISADLTDGHAAIMQLVSTVENLMDRRLSEFPGRGMGDLLNRRPLDDIGRRNRADPRTH